MFKKILIANRGEIAVRIIRCCRDLGIRSAAIYSDADKLTLHTRFADESYNIGSSVSSESYLNQKKIIALAKKIKADAFQRIQISLRLVKKKRLPLLVLHPLPLK